MKAAVLWIALSACSAPIASVGEPSTSRVRWETWSDAVFERARGEERLVLLDLEAVWCHWCHVMDEVTYADPEVARLIGEHYVAVRVDQDSRPDLANRYEDYGWPATVVFDANGRELALRSGFIQPRAMAEMLRAFAADPTPGPSASAGVHAETIAVGGLDGALAAELERAWIESYDSEHGGWGFSHKYLDPTSTEYAIAHSLEGDAEAERMARGALDAELALVDPAWGGVYQYSTGGVWTEPHFEKIMSMQAENLRLYALAFTAWKDPRHLAAARAIESYLALFLTSPEGAFYTSQDADLVQGEHSAEYFALGDAQRRALGIPRVDKHAYARENGWAIRALCALYGATGDASALASAERATRWILAHRALDGGGFGHGERDTAGPYLGDTLAMGLAFLALYEATAERAWLERALAASSFIGARFRSEVGFATSAEGEILAPAPQRGENLDLARYENALFQHTGAGEHHERAEHALRFVASPPVARRFPAAAALLAARELAGEPLHVTVIGAKSDARARALYAAALALAATYRRVEWLDAAEGPLPRGDVEYPELDRPAAFTCSAGRCSRPAFEPNELAERVAALRPGQ